MSAIQPIRVLIVDDHSLVRSGLRNFLFAYDWIQLLGEAANGLEAVEFCAQNPVDVVLMDMVMPEMDGASATEKIVALGKSINVIVLTSFHEQDLVEQALKAGATSYLLKNVTAAELAQAIQLAHSGRPTLAPEATEALISAARRNPSQRYGLTDREMQVLQLLAQGRSNLEIADELSISLATVKFHLSNIYEKLGTRNRLAAVTVARDFKLIPID